MKKAISTIIILASLLLIAYTYRCSIDLKQEKIKYEAQNRQLEFYNYMAKYQIKNKGKH